MQFFKTIAGLMKGRAELSRREPYEVRDLDVWYNMEGEEYKISTSTTEEGAKRACLALNTAYAVGAFATSMHPDCAEEMRQVMALEGFVAQEPSGAETVHVVIFAAGPDAIPMPDLSRPVPPNEVN